MIQGFAYASTLGTPRSYFKSLKMMERAVPEKILEQWRGLEPELRAWQTVVSSGRAADASGAVCALSDGAARHRNYHGGTVGDPPPFLAGWFAGKKFPDDRNVISLWKILVGVPIFMLWMVCLSITLI